MDDIEKSREQIKRMFEASRQIPTQPPTTAPTSTSEAEIDIDNMQLWASQDSEMLRGLQNPGFPFDPFRKTLAIHWWKHDPDLFESIAHPSNQQALIPVQAQEETQAIASSPAWLKYVWIGGGVVLGGIVLMLLVGVVRGLAENPAPQLAASPSPVPTEPTPTPEPDLPLAPDAEPDLINPHEVYGDGDCLNVRDHHGTEIGCIPVGAKVSVTGYSGDRMWAVTEYKGRAAYLFTRFLRPVGQDKDRGLSSVTR